MHSAAATPFVLTGLWLSVFWLSGCRGCSRSESESERATPTAVALSVEPLPIPPPGIGAGSGPPDNPTTVEKATLGRALFFSTALASGRDATCGTCHVPDRGFGGEAAVEKAGVGDAPPRHAPSLWLVGYQRRFGWDGRFATLEDATRAMWESMAGGKQGLAASLRAIGQSSETRARFSQAFSGSAPTEASVVQALAAFQRTLVCGQSAYDRFAAGESGALNEQQVLGWTLFSGKAGCAECHAPPYFSDALGPGGEGFHNTGVGRLDRDRPDSDGGRARVTKSDDDWGAFKTPTLRGTAAAARFFHDGSIGVLDGAVILMARGGRDNPHRSPKLRDAALEPHEIQSIIDFLPALDCNQVVSSAAGP